VKTYIGTIGAVASFIIGGVIGWVYPPRGHFQIQDRQVMAGEWSISIQTQPCDKGELGVHMPERDGDVITVYCKTMPVAAR
jgi:hypothetical protein